MAWLAAFHLLGVIFWVGSLLVITRLLALAGGEAGMVRQRMVAASRRLLVGGASTGAAITIVFGTALVTAHPKTLAAGWFHLKLFLVLVLVAVHFWIYRKLTVREGELSPADARRFSTLHGAIGLLLLGILILVLVQPF
jgi:putative membrane protein